MKLSSPARITPCNHLTAFKASGSDVRSFLQSQLTQDVTTVSPTQATLAGFCTAQGRLWSSMLLIQSTSQDDLLGIASADLIDSFLKRLRMFVLRSKVTIEPAPDCQVYGVEINASDLAAISDKLGIALPKQTWGAVSASSLGSWTRVPANTEQIARFLALLSSTQIDTLRELLGDQAQIHVNTNAWEIGDIRAGFAWVQAATQDLFIAQTLNLDLIQGVSFTKGCYPGQEVIARAHYRGTIKRRMHLATVTSYEVALHPAMDIFTADEPDNPVGRIISVATDPDTSKEHGSQSWMLFEAPFKALGDEPLRAGSATGPALTVQPLPYDVNP